MVDVRVNVSENVSDVRFVPLIEGTLERKIAHYSENEAKHRDEKETSSRYAVPKRSYRCVFIFVFFHKHSPKNTSAMFSVKNKNRLEIIPQGR